MRTSASVHAYDPVDHLVKNNAVIVAQSQAKTTITPELKQRIFTICLTGGPCSGKSSSLASFTKALTAKGFDVYCVPEVRSLSNRVGFAFVGGRAGGRPVVLDRVQSTCPLGLRYCPFAA